MVKTRKKLIEMALPLDAINKASAYEKMPGIGPHPRGLHLWWARRPLAAARAVIFSQMVDDPSACPEEFPTEEAQEQERQRLFRLIEELVKWENTTNERVLNRARKEIRRSWRRACADNADHPQAAELFNPDKLPAFHDPFAGGGALPLEAQRLGLEAYASDLNPVAVLINKAMIEIPPKFAGRPPVNPEARAQKSLIEMEWRGAEGLAGDVRYYGKWMRDEAEKRIGHFYPKVEITPEMTKDRPDLLPYVGREHTVIAWLWARTVKSPNPAFAHVDVPLVSNFMLSTKKGKEAYVEPVIERGGYHFKVRAGKPIDEAAVKRGTKSSRGANFVCVMSGTPIASDHIKAEGRAGRMSDRLMAIVAEGNRGRIYIDPPPSHEATARQAKPEWEVEGGFVHDARAFTPYIYGISEWKDLFSSRQALALATFSDLLHEVRGVVQCDAASAGVVQDHSHLCDDGIGSTAYAEAVTVYLQFAMDRCADFSNSCTRWVPGNQKVMNLFGKQAIGMTWDYPEAAVLHETVGGFEPAAGFVAACIKKLPIHGMGEAHQQDAASNTISNAKVVSTDPPYFDNVPYADLSDFFYVWMRRSLKPIFGDLFATLVVPKAEELVAFAYRHGGKEGAEKFFLDGMTAALQQIAVQAHPGFPVTVYYAFKQAESDGAAGTASTGWETFLEAVIRSGLAVCGTWPMRSEQEFRMRGMGSNALASSIVLVCRPRAKDYSAISRRELLTVLKAELPISLFHLRASNIAPVDLAQAAIGPGMAVFTRYARVLEADGSTMKVRSALQLINQMVDEIFSEEEQELDADTRFALTWYESHKFDEGPYGEAETLATARGVAVAGVAESGILKSAAGKVRLLMRSGLPDDWDPKDDDRLTAWEETQHLIKRLEEKGESEAAELLAKLGSSAEQARTLAYRLYTTCERKGWAEEAQAYNGLVLAWPELEKLAGEARAATETETQAGLFE